MTVSLIQKLLIAQQWHRSQRNKLLIDINKIETIKKEKVITKQYHSIEHRTLRFAKDEDNTFASESMRKGYCCLIFPFWLIHVPYKMIESIDRDRGIAKENSVQLMDVLKKSLDINDGYIILEEENIKIPVAHNKVIINLNQLRLKQLSYNFDLYDGGIAKQKFILVTPLLRTKLAEYYSKEFNTIKEIDDAIELLNKFSINSLT